MAILLKASQVIQGSPEVLLDSGQVIIGRLPTNHLMIPGSEVDPIHALVEVDPSGEATLTDLGSESGVRLNGRRIEVAEVVRPGDTIAIGAVIIEVLDPALAPAEPVSDAPISDDPRRTKPSGDMNKSARNQAAKSPRIPVSGVPAPAPHQNPRRATVGAPRTPLGTPNKDGRPGPALFDPGRERPQGSTLEVVAFWDQSILDVRHYGGRTDKGDDERSSKVYIGDEQDGDLIGVGPHANTKHTLLASCDGGKTRVVLNSDMRAKVRSGSEFKKVQGPTEFGLSSKEMCFVSHGPVHYFLKNVSMPKSAFPRFNDIDGKPVIFIYTWLVWAILSVGIYANKELNPIKPKVDTDPWSVALALRTPTPTPKPVKPAPKPPVEVKTPPPAPPPPKVETPKPQPPKETTPPPTPKPVVKATPPPVPPKEQVALQPPKVPPKEQPAVTKEAPKGEKPNTKDKALGRKTNGPAGNSGGKAGGTTGAFAGQRQGNQKSDNMGVEDGKKDTLSGINIDQLGAGLGKTMDLNGAGAVATGLRSSAGGEGKASGSGARGSHGFGGLGDSNSLATGGPSRALSGLGGGAGGLGSGGEGGQGAIGGSGRRVKASVVVVPESDPVVDGGLTREEIAAVIQANMAQIRYCYEKNLQGNRNLAGRLAVNFVVGTNGRVSSSKVNSSTLSHGPTENCVLDAIRKWKFPIPRGLSPVSVNYPFVFNPS